MPTLTIRGKEVEVALLDDEEVQAKFQALDHQYLTCRNHPTALYVTKNPSTRTLHFVRAADEAPKTMFDRAQAGWGGPANLECPCPFSDLVVLRDGDPL